MRPLALYAVLVGLTGCYTPQTVTEIHAMEVWRAVQAQREDTTTSEAQPAEPLTLTAQGAARPVLQSTGNHDCGRSGLNRAEAAGAREGDDGPVSEDRLRTPVRFMSTL